MDVLQLALQAERTAPDLTRLPPEMILAAMTRLDELRDAIHPTPTSELFEQYDSLTDHLGTIAMMRAKKIRDAVGYGRPMNMLPQEIAFYDAVDAATTALVRAWGIG
ncbi:MAG TPA: hypothetical protein PLY91_10025 [Methanoregulaceae archaeon]|mgnify:CR=1 FL=1|nr:hypothetical protein [Methanoregulaceae archaeon]